MYDSERNGPQSADLPPPGAIYMYITMIFKDLLSNRLANQRQTSCGAFLGRENERLYKWSRSHEQDDSHGNK